MSSLVAESISKSYVRGTEAVHPVRDVSLSLQYGKFDCLYGVSGCGKSTLLRLLSGLEKPDHGSVRFGESVISDAAAVAERVRLHHIGMVFQDNNLLDVFSAVENVMLPLRARGLTAREAREVSIEALSRLSIAELADANVQTLSGGQRQRVGIARALAGERRVLLADEPTGALDSATSAALFKTLAHLANTGAAVLVVTHDPMAAEYADRTWTMRDGMLTLDD